MPRFMHRKTMALLRLNCQGAYRPKQHLVARLLKILHQDLGAFLSGGEYGRLVYQVLDIGA